MGIIGCSTIVPRAIITPSKELDNLCIYGIASRTKIKAQNYAKKYNIANAFDSYEDLLNCPNIDCVYIALANDLHKHWILKAIEAKKHILIEKPICLSTKEFDLILEKYKNSNIHILEGVMIEHHPWQETVKSIICSEIYGKLENIKTSICIVPKDKNENSYRRFPQRGGGAFYDLSCYWLQFLQYITSSSTTSYNGFSEFNGPNNCDWTFNANLKYDNGLKSSFISSFELPYKVEHILEFETANIKVHDFFRACLGNFKINITIEDKYNNLIKKITFEPQNYYVNQLKFFLEVINGNKENIPLKNSYERIALMENIYKHTKVQSNTIVK